MLLGMYSGHKTYSNLLGAAAKGVSIGGVTTKDTMVVGAIIAAVVVAACWCTAGFG